MKKILALILTIAMVAALFTGCTGTTVVIGECTCPTGSHDEVIEMPTEPVVAETSGADSVALKTGLSVSTSVKDTIAATAESNGAVKYDVTLAAVTVDDAGVIRSCVIDSIPATLEFDATGAIVTDLSAAISTKNELGENYGMVAWGGAIAEWDAQVQAVADYAIGKTVEQLKNGDIDMTTGKAKDGTDLQSSATIYLAGYVYAIEAAVNNAQHLGASVGDELVLATLPKLSSSASVTAETAGLAQLDVDIVALTRNNGVITSCYIDSLQAKVEFDNVGAILTDLTAPIKTKNELGADYGMVAWAGAIAEWNEQAASYAAYITGKTMDEVNGIAITETTKPAEGTDLASSVTIAIGGFQALIAKAMQ